MHEIKRKFATERKSNKFSPRKTLECGGKDKNQPRDYAKSARERRADRQAMVLLRLSSRFSLACTPFKYSSGYPFPFSSERSSRQLSVQHCVLKSALPFDKRRLKL